MMLHVTSAQYLDGFRIRLRFNNGAEGDVDLAGALTGPVFAPLQNPDEFRRFKVEGHTVSWANGADFAPEFLHSLLPIAARSA